MVLFLTMNKAVICVCFTLAKKAATWKAKRDRFKPTFLTRHALFLLVCKCLWDLDGFACFCFEPVLDSCCAHSFCGMLPFVSQNQQHLSGVCFVFEWVYANANWMHVDGKPIVILRGKCVCKLRADFHVKILKAFCFFNF